MAIQRFHPQAEVVPPDLAALHQQVADLSAENEALRLDLAMLQALVTPSPVAVHFIHYGPC